MKFYIFSRPTLHTYLDRRAKEAKLNHDDHRAAAERFRQKAARLNALAVEADTLANLYQAQEDLINKQLSQVVKV